MRYMLDTDIASYLIRGDHPGVTKKFAELYEKCVISSITAAELQYGAMKRSNRLLIQKVQALCDLIPIISWNEGAAGCYAKLRVELEAAGTPIGNMDMMIAASAIVEEAVLITNNTGHFSKIASLDYEDWC